MEVARALLVILLLHAGRCSVEECGKVYGEDVNRVTSAVQGPPGKVGAPGTVDYEKLKEIMAAEQERVRKGLRRDMRAKLIENKREIFSELESQTLMVISKENKELRLELEEVKATLGTLVKWESIDGLRRDMQRANDEILTELESQKRENDELRARLKEAEDALERMRGGSKATQQSVPATTAAAGSHSRSDILGCALIPRSLLSAENDEKLSARCTKACLGEIFLKWIECLSDCPKYCADIYTACTDCVSDVSLSSTLNKGWRLHSTITRPAAWCRYGEEDD